MNDKLIVKEIEGSVRKFFLNESTGHDWWHCQRVKKMGLQIAKEEKANLFIIELAAIVHDVADYKLHNGNEEKGNKIIEDWFNAAGIQPSFTETILDIVESISFTKTLKDPSLVNVKKLLSKEAMVLSDADRLDAMGAIGIARTFAFGGFSQRPIYDPNIPPRITLTQEEYKKKDTSSINHFYEKLLKLKDMMYTPTGKKIAQIRHEFMEFFLKRFFNEWEGIP